MAAGTSASYTVEQAFDEALANQGQRIAGGPPEGSLGAAKACRHIHGARHNDEHR